MDLLLVILKEKYRCLILIVIVSGLGKFIKDKLGRCCMIMSIDLCLHLGQKGKLVHGHREILKQNRKEKLLTLGKSR